MAAGAVRKLDHVLLPLSDPKVGWLHLAETLRLPIYDADGRGVDPWSPSGRDIVERVRRGDRFAGEVGLGNVNLEPSSGDWQVLRDGRAHIQSIALEPVLPTPELLDELERRGIEHASPNDLGPQEFDGTVWHYTLVHVFGLLDPASSSVFFCRCHAPLGYVDAAMRQATLDACGGGVLGVLGAAEVVIGATDVARAMEAWRQLLDPAPEPTPGCWRVGSGPAVRLVEADVDGIVELVLDVRSLDDAHAAASGVGLAVERGEAALSVRMDALDGFTLTLR